MSLTASSAYTDKGTLHLAFITGALPIISNPLILSIYQVSSFGYFNNKIGYFNNKIWSEFLARPILLSLFYTWDKLNFLETFVKNTRQSFS